MMDGILVAFFEASDGTVKGDGWVEVDGWVIDVEGCAIVDGRFGSDREASSFVRCRVVYGLESMVINASEESLQQIRRNVKPSRWAPK